MKDIPALLKCSLENFGLLYFLSSESDLLSCIFMKPYAARNSFYERNPQERPFSLPGRPNSEKNVT